MDFDDADYRYRAESKLQKELAQLQAKVREVQAKVQEEARLHQEGRDEQVTAKESQCPTDGALVYPPPPSAADPHGEGSAAEKMNCYGKVQRIVYETVVEPPEGYRAGKIFGSSILLLITVNIVVGVLETVPELFAKYGIFFYYFELVSVVIFTVEYVLMLWSCVLNPQFGIRGSTCGRIKAATRPLAIVDILAIAPFYLSSFVQLDLRFVRVLRLFRIFRLFRSGKMADSFKLLSAVILSKQEQLTLGLMILILAVLLVSSVMYIIEQDQANTKFTSIPASMWWGIISVTTIGYGDMVPDSPLGKVFASFVGISGICVLAIPVGIIGAGFLEHSAPAAESGTGGRTVPQVAPETGTGSSGSHASSGDRTPTAQRRPSTELEMSAVATVLFAAEETPESVLESHLISVVPCRPKESQSLTNRDMVCPPPPSAADPHGEGNAAEKMNCYGKVQRIMYETVVEPPEGYRAGEIFGSSILLLITVNIIVGVLETVPELFAKYEKYFYYFELVSVVIFTVEYVLMLWSCVADPQFGSRGTVCGRIKAATRPLAIVDILAIAPFYLSSFVVDLRFIRVLRLFRIFRLFRSGKMADSFKLLLTVILSNQEQLTLGLMIIILAVLLVSSVMYIIEKDQANTKFTSIPASMWWGINSVTTIGYGDMVPDSPLGKVFASFVAFLGICSFAIPVGIIGAGFANHITPAAESGTGDRTVSQVAPEIGTDGSGDRTSATQRRPSSELEMSAATTMPFAV